MRPTPDARRQTLLIFDFDGTLADTWRDIGTALNRTLDEAGLPAATDAEVRDWIGHGVRALLSRATAARPPDADALTALVGRFRVHYDGCCLETTALYPGIAACLAALSGRTLAILSNKPDRLLAKIALALGIADRFAAIVGGDRLVAPKPDPAAIAQVVAAIGGAPERLWMIGDSAVDVATGRAAGARTIGCAWGLRGAAELHAAAADVVVEHPAQIPPLIAG